MKKSKAAETKAAGGPPAGAKAAGGPPAPGPKPKPKPPVAAPPDVMKKPGAKGQIPRLGCSKCRYLKGGCGVCRERLQQRLAALGIFFDD